MPRERELQLGHVPAGHSGREGAGAEDVPREASQGAARLRADDAVGGQTVKTLKADYGGSRHRSGDTVDRAPVDVVVAQRDLQRGDGRATGGVGARRPDERDHERERKQVVMEACHPSYEGSAGMAKSLAARPPGRQPRQRVPVTEVEAPRVAPPFGGQGTASRSTPAIRT